MCMDINTKVCMHACMYVFTMRGHERPCICVYEYCMYVCMYMCACEGYQHIYIHTYIHTQGLSWTASAKHLEGKTHKDLAMGYIPLPDHIRKARTVRLNTADFKAPVDFDARDVDTDEMECSAFNVLDQVCVCVSVCVCVCECVFF